MQNLRFGKGEFCNQCIAEERRVERQHGDPAKGAGVVAKDKEDGAVGEAQHDIAPVPGQSLVVGLPAVALGDDLVDRVGHDQERQHEVEPYERVEGEQGGFAHSAGVAKLELGVDGSWDGHTGKREREREREGEEKGGCGNGGGGYTEDAYFSVLKPKKKERARARRRAEHQNEAEATVHASVRLSSKFVYHQAGDQQHTHRNRRTRMRGNNYCLQQQQQHMENHAETSGGQQGKERCTKKKSRT